jgi:hypothetical protein
MEYLSFTPTAIVHARPTRGVTVPRGLTRTTVGITTPAQPRRRPFRTPPGPHRSTAPTAAPRRGLPRSRRRHRPPASASIRRVPRAPSSPLVLPRHRGRPATRRSGRHPLSHPDPTAGPRSCRWGALPMVLTEVSGPGVAAGRSRPHLFVAGELGAVASRSGAGGRGCRGFALVTLAVWRRAIVECERLPIESDPGGGGSGVAGGDHSDPARR